MCVLLFSKMTDFIISRYTLLQWEYICWFTENTPKKPPQNQPKAFKDVFLLNGFYSYCKGWIISYCCQQWEGAIQPPALLWFPVYEQVFFLASLCRPSSAGKNTQYVYAKHWVLLDLALFFTVVQLKNRNISFSKDMHIRHLIAIEKFNVRKEQGSTTIL